MNLRSFLVAIALAWTAFIGPSVYAQGKAFSYQSGSFDENGQSANGNFDSRSHCSHTANMAFQPDRFSQIWTYKRLNLRPLRGFKL